MSLIHEDDCSVSKPIEHALSTPSIVSGSTNMGPPSHEGRKNRSKAWNHFIQIEPKLDKRAQCKYCDILIRYEKGTTAMRNHVLRRPNNPNKRQKVGSSSTIDGNINSPSYGRFDQEICQEELVKMFVEVELPFRFVEHVAFRRYSNALQPRFKIPSHYTISRNIVTLWNAKKIYLKDFISQHCQRVCLTTDAWTSPQNQSYMCLTPHFIDNDWNLHKRILNFRQVISHTGEAMAKFVESCLHEWGLSRVLTLTIDNATSNDTGVQHLKKILLSWNNSVLKGDYTHMRCCAHILNLIVSSGLKEIDNSILRIRAAVKYIRSSPSRFMKFKECVESQKIEYKGHICLDVETRWNSTYLMLDVAFKHKMAFVELEFYDTKYANELGKGIGLPSYEDWEYVESILPFLSIFYEATLRISGNSYVTSNIYMLEVVGIWNGINHLLKSNATSSATYKMA
ncbi:zinc finger BED domain-containing protein RICESLEEPER 2-like [Vigna unguiculata]|uniref:zinc finger BED domain-containing protein RICESLEEPER 2-like n=1 Tax=Vigna unguiculata TaxID=3917 RepID=UPI0010166969|nr:zinc finger BED domain-containing protein RICESLEEPER 2-like [Vigna unguiculata]